MKGLEFVGLLFARQPLVRLLSILLATLIMPLTACSVHKLDIQQGNIVTQEMVDKLKVGMEDVKVRRIAGTPLINDPFRNNRWDYVYRFLQGSSGKLQYSYVTLFFENHRLKEIKVHSQLLKREEIHTLHKQAKGNRT
ncbi:MAG: outer membrane protein assembly factor BamE [Gammaproteobacteria bacterium]|nr:outer membrane protein assembly factor BamE [Gammaproteobacteria bacterium]